MSVQYKSVPNFPEYYVGSDGSLFSTKRGREIQMKPSTTGGYAKVQLVDGSRKENWQVHRLVAKLFIPNKKKLEIVNHIDGDKLNNDVSNLEWTTRAGNARHYENTLAGKKRADRQAKKDSDMKTRLAIIQHAHLACTANPELFYSIYETVMGE